MLPQLVIFDVDGLLLDTEQVWKKAWRRTADSFGLLDLKDEEFHRLIGKSGQASMEETRKILKGACGAEEFMERMRACGLKMLDEDLRLKPGARELLEELKEKGIRRAVATATSRELTKKRLGRMGILPFFSCICCGDEVERGKPFPDIYMKVLEHMECPADRAVVLEDSPVGVEAAFRAGIPCVMVPDVILPGEAEKERAAWIAPSLFQAGRWIFQGDRTGMAQTEA